MVWRANHGAQYSGSAIVTAFLVFTVAGCFMVELGCAKPKSSESLSRKILRSVSGIKEACRFYLFESGIDLMLAFLINVSIISTSGAVCNSSDNLISPVDKQNCQDLDLNKASFLLKHVLEVGAPRSFWDVSLFGGVLYCMVRKTKNADNLLPETVQMAAELGNAPSVSSLPREHIVNMQLPQWRTTSDVDKNSSSSKVFIRQAKTVLLLDKELGFDETCTPS
ncbi:hypothetical protein ACH5RR_003876 [Cinchona calisaya]|uniref:Uncharacterized protein n=1 Tax=Cinchona calisaya TaxID=153742 RepID=A0ABD3AWA4_9GENT